MKIEINADGKGEATITIDGVDMKVEIQPGMTSLEGCPADEKEEIMGSMIAGQLYDLVAKIDSSISMAEEYMGDDFNTWCKMPDHVAEAAYDEIVL